jgi:hypothetical protein
MGTTHSLISGTGIHTEFLERKSLGRQEGDLSIILK